MAAAINVLSAGAVKPGLAKVVEAFLLNTGHDIKIAFATAPVIRKEIGDGITPDVVIAPPDVLDDLVKAGKPEAAERVMVGRIGIGVMVRSGAPVPRIATVEEFKQSLLSAESIVYNQASTGIYLEALFDRLGIAAQLQTKSTRYPDFAAVRDHVGKGHGIEIGLGATTVIIESISKGVHFVGPLPTEIQNYTAYAATVTTAGAAKEAAQSLINYLASAGAKARFKAAGIE